METTHVGQLAERMDQERQKASALALHGAPEKAASSFRSILERLRAAHAMGGLDTNTLRLQRAQCYRELGHIEVDRGDGIAAEALFRKSAALFGTLGQDAAQAEVQKALGKLASDNNRPDMAQRWFEAASKSFQLAGKPAQAGLMRLQVLQARCLLQGRKSSPQPHETGQRVSIPSPSPSPALEAVRESMILSIHAVEKHGEHTQRVHAQALAEHICRLVGDGEAMVWHMAQRLHLLEAENRMLRTDLQQAGKAAAQHATDSPDAEAATKPDQDGAAAAADHEAMRTFIHKAAHDMKEPLRMISGFGGLIQRRYAEALQEDGMEYLGVVLDAGKRMQELLDKLLVHARIGVEAPGESRVALSEVLDLLVQQQGQAWADRGADIQCAVQGQWPGDPFHWQTALQELIDNALRFNQSEKPLVKVEGLNEGQDLVLRVTDNGIGIESRFQKDVFKLFRRLHSRAEYRGSGIGLAIVERIASTYGGSCSCSTQPEGGTCFELRIPKPEPRLETGRRQTGERDLPPAA